MSEAQCVYQHLGIKSERQGAEHTFSPGSNGYGVEALSNTLDAEASKLGLDYLTAKLSG